MRWETRLSRGLAMPPIVGAASICFCPACGQSLSVGNTGQDQTRASMNRMADILAKEKAQLWINHDKAQRDSQRMSPEYYE